MHQLIWSSFTIESISGKILVRLLLRGLKRKMRFLNKLQLYLSENSQLYLSEAKSSYFSPPTQPTLEHQATSWFTKNILLKNKHFQLYIKINKNFSNVLIITSNDLQFSSRCKKWSLPANAFYNWAHLTPRVTFVPFWKLYLCCNLFVDRCLAASKKVLSTPTTPHCGRDTNNAQEQQVCWWFSTVDIYCNPLMLEMLWSI